MYSGFEKLSNLSQIEFFEKHLNKFLVIEPAKHEKLTFLGNEKQSLIWMVNLTAEKYSEYWYYFGSAFKYYQLYEKLFVQYKNGTFRNKHEKLSKLQYLHCKEFEGVVGVLYS